MKTFLKKEDGVVLVVVVFLMTAFLAVLALVLDAGSIYLEKNRLQKIVDAAVLAGAQELPMSSTKAIEQANKSIQLNEGQVSNFTTEINTSHTSIKVKGSKQVKLVFAGALGFDDFIIQAQATAQLSPLSSAKGAIPLGVMASTNLQFGSVYYLKTGTSDNGNFGAIELSGTGANNYENDMKYGYNAQLKNYQILELESGNMVGSTQKAVEYRISFCPNATYDNHSFECPRRVTVPIYEPVTVESNKLKEVRIVGFATFFIERFSSNGEVVGRFIKGTQSGDSIDGQRDFGTYTFKLIQ